MKRIQRLSATIALAILVVSCASAPKSMAADKKDPAADSGKIILNTFLLGVTEDEQGKASGVSLREDTIMYTGDGVKIVFETDRETHVYVLLLDAQGKCNVIFPGEGMGTNPVKANKQYQLPPWDGKGEGEPFFVLDQNTGTETIYTLAMLEPIEDLKKIIKSIEASVVKNSPESTDDAVIDSLEAEGIIKRKAKGEKKTRERKRHIMRSGKKRRRPPVVIAGVVRGIKVVKKGKSVRVQAKSGQTIENKFDQISGDGVILRAVSFEHR